MEYSGQPSPAFAPVGTRWPVEPGRATGPTSRGRRTDLDRAGRLLYDGPPKVREDTGLPYKGMILEATTAAGKKVGCQVTVTVGDGAQGAGAEAQRSFIVAPGAPIFLAVGSWGQVAVRIDQVNGDKWGALNLLWSDNEALAAFGVALQAPMVTTAGGVAAATPPGAFEVEVDSAVALVWADDTSSAGTENWTDVVAAGGRVRCKGAAYTPGAGGVKLRFYLLPF